MIIKFKHHGKYVTKPFIVIVSLVLVAYCLIAGYRLPIYHYESSDRGMAELEVPWKGRHFHHVQRRFEEYKAWSKDPNVYLCRTCKPHWSSWNLIIDNFTHERWNLPYIEPSEDPNRHYYRQMGKDRDLKNISLHRDWLHRVKAVTFFGAILFYVIWRTNVLSPRHFAKGILHAILTLPE